VSTDFLADREFRVASLSGFQYSIVVALSTRPQSRGVGLPQVKEHSYNMLWIHSRGNKTENSFIH
jgi:hypothetical protein